MKNLIRKKILKDFWKAYMKLLESFLHIGMQEGFQEIHRESADKTIKYIWKKVCLFFPAYSSSNTTPKVDPVAFQIKFAVKSAFAAQEIRTPYDGKFDLEIISEDIFKMPNFIMRISNSMIFTKYGNKACLKNLILS